MNTETRLSNLEKQMAQLIKTISNQNQSNESSFENSRKSDADLQEQTSDLQEKTDCIKITYTQSDKLGYDWKITMVGDLEASKEYVPQENPKGTSPDNPIIWEDWMTPINNAFYLKDGKIQVYMDGQWIDWEV